MFFRHSGLPKTLLDKCLKNRVSEDPSTDNIRNALKHCCNLNESTFTIYISQSEGNALQKVYFSDIKSRRTVF